MHLMFVWFSRLNFDLKVKVHYICIHFYFFSNAYNLQNTINTPEYSNHISKEYYIHKYDNEDRNADNPTAFSKFFKHFFLRFTFN